MTNESASSELHENLFRILDAATNRGREAIRVVEDLIRFVFDEESLTKRLKTFRHDYSILTQQIPSQKRMQFRDTPNDIGTTIQGKGEYHRCSLREILTANFCRLQESLRSLEEFCKMILPQLAPGFEQLRYRSYTLEQNVYQQVIAHVAQKEPLSNGSPAALGSQPQEPSFQPSTFLASVFQPSVRREARLTRLNDARLYVILDTTFSDDAFRELLTSGVDLCQLRDKTASDRTLVETGRRWRKIVAETFSAPQASAPLLIMNDRPDLALLTDFDGVHVGQEELEPRDVRQIVGDSLLVGLSTHHLAQALEAEEMPVDYLGAGPVFPSQTKTFQDFAGLEYLKTLAQLACDQKITKPFFAIGGISGENLELVLKTGAKNVAVASSIAHSPFPKKSAATMKKRLLDFRNP